MKKLSDQLSALTDRTKQTEETVDAARDKNRKKLDAQLTSIKASADKNAKAVKADFASAKTTITTKGNAARASIDARFVEIREHAETRQAEHHTKKASHDADVAEQVASDAVDLALYALDLAEFAIVDAAIMRAMADEVDATA
jgi:hypothetical protein